MKFLIAALSLGFSFSLHAEEKTCSVKGMHCTGCTEMVQGKVCDEGENKGKYSKCDVKIVDEKKEIGQIDLATKDANVKIDEKAVSAAVKDAGYKLEKCVAPKKKKT